MDLSPETIHAVVGSGGVVGLVVLLVRWWRGRPRLQGRFVGETYDLRGDPGALATLVVELKNVGREDTSIGSEVRLVFRTAQREKIRAVLTVEGNDRTLNPVQPRIINLHGSVPATYLFSHFREIEIYASRGQSIKLRVLNASGKSAGRLRFAWLRLAFVLFGALPHIEA